MDDASDISEGELREAPLQGGQQSWAWKEAEREFFEDGREPNWRVRRGLPKKLTFESFGVHAAAPEVRQVISPVDAVCKLRAADVRIGAGTTAARRAGGGQRKFWPRMRGLLTAGADGLLLAPSGRDIKSLVAFQALPLTDGSLDLLPLETEISMPRAIVELRSEGDLHLLRCSQSLVLAEAASRGPVRSLRNMELPELAMGCCLSPHVRGELATLHPSGIRVWDAMSASPFDGDRKLTAPSAQGEGRGVPLPGAASGPEQTVGSPALHRVMGGSSVVTWWTHPEQLAVAGGDISLVDLRLGRSGVMVARESQTEALGLPVFQQVMALERDPTQEFQLLATAACPAQVLVFDVRRPDCALLRLPLPDGVSDVHEQWSPLADTAIGYRSLALHAPGGGRRHRWLAAACVGGFSAVMFCWQQEVKAGGRLNLMNGSSLPNVDMLEVHARPGVELRTPEVGGRLLGSALAEIDSGNPPLLFLLSESGGITCQRFRWQHAGRRAGKAEPPPPPPPPAPRQTHRPRRALQGAALASAAKARLKAKGRANAKGQPKAWGRPFVKGGRPCAAPLAGPAGSAGAGEPRDGRRGPARPTEKTRWQPPRACSRPQRPHRERLAPSASSARRAFAWLSRRPGEVALALEALGLLARGPAEAPRSVYEALEANRQKMDALWENMEAMVSQELAAADAPEPPAATACEDLVVVSSDGEAAACEDLVPANGDVAEPGNSESEPGFQPEFGSPIDSEVPPGAEGELQMRGLQVGIPETASELRSSLLGGELPKPIAPDAEPQVWARRLAVALVLLEVRLPREWRFPTSPPPASKRGPFAPWSLVRAAAAASGGAPQEASVVLQGVRILARLLVRFGLLRCASFGLCAEEAPVPHLRAGLEAYEVVWQAAPEAEDEEKKEPGKRAPRDGFQQALTGLRQHWHAQLVPEVPASSAGSALPAAQKSGLPLEEPQRRPAQRPVLPLAAAAPHTAPAGGSATASRGAPAEPPAGPPKAKKRRAGF